MTPITDMALPDEVVRKAAASVGLPLGEKCPIGMDDTPYICSAKGCDACTINWSSELIRAALQAMLDNGMARFIGWPKGDDAIWLAIRLDADARKREERT